MEFELAWLLLIPVAFVIFAAGWFTARIDLRALLSESRALPSTYFRGLNFLLHDQPDKAVDAFLEVAKSNPNTAELQFALGSLFRRRGEIDRAIRMHGDLSERGDLAPEERTRARFELAQDYLKSGLLDRAEKVLRDLIGTSYGPQALDYLLDMYVQEKDWPKAIDTARELERVSTKSYREEIAHYYCELAQTEYSHSNFDAARGHLDDALAASRRCVRANLLKGEWEARDARHDSALQALNAIETQSPAHLSLAARGMWASYKALGREKEGVTRLRALQERYPSVDLLEVVLQAELETHGADAAYRLARDDLRRNATLLGLDKLFDARLLEANPDEREEIQLMKGVVQAASRQMSHYQCTQCGFRARQFYWHCPACRSWESFPPRRAAERDPQEEPLAKM